MTVAKFKNPCTCGGYAHTMNGRDPANPHMGWCPQAEEYAKWYKLQKDISDKLTESILEAEKNRLSTATLPLDTLRESLEQIQRLRRALIHIQNSYIELSYDKAAWQRDQFIRDAKDAVDRSYKRGRYSDDNLD